MSRYGAAAALTAILALGLVVVANRDPGPPPGEPAVATPGTKASRQSPPPRVDAGPRGAGGESAATAATDGAGADELNERDEPDQPDEGAEREDDAGDEEQSDEAAADGDQGDGAGDPAPGELLTRYAAQLPPMADLEPSDPKYDSGVDARQLFHPFEAALRGHGELNPEAWRRTLAEHKDTNWRVMERANELNQAGAPDEAEALLAEWNRLYGLYQDKAYGRKRAEP